ncbi:hypothetical protein [Nitrosopumilus adriaticus]|uniref:hypothetical protein n=1 Tax=Nitrosopumilus adriaticus TaxID=1580092 RepID=UPI00352EDAA6
MKTRTLIIIGITLAIVISITYVSLTYNQEIKLATGMMTSDEKPQPSKLSDPICFVVDKATSGETGSAVAMGACLTLKQFEEMGCTKPMLEHILRYSNLLDEEVDGPVYLEWAGLPKDVTQENFDKCFDSILEKRPMLNSKLQDESKTCPNGQDYNQVLFKCVISCEDDFVYNGYTDSCTTVFELKYHGYCDEVFTYNPSSHTCYSDDGSLQTPLKDPPRTAPPEPELNPETRSIVTVQDRPANRTIVPITITEKTTNAQTLDTVVQWNFSLLGIEMATLNDYWGNLADQYITTELVDQEGNDVVDYSRVPDGQILYKLSLQYYPAICDDGQKIKGEGGYPEPIPIKNGTTDVFLKSGSMGLYPDSEGKYFFDFVSGFETDVEYHPNVIVISEETKKCQLEIKRGDFTDVYYTHAVFGFDD